MSAEEQALVVEVAPDDEGDLGFDLGLDELAGGDVPAVGHGHVGKQHAVVGLTDAELPLHGERGQADLAADQLAPFGEPALGVELLGGVGLIDGPGREHLAHRRHGRACLVSAEDGVSDGERRYLCHVSFPSQSFTQTLVSSV